MKFANTIILLAALLFSIGVQAQKLKTVSFKVYGNCGMCKSKIEHALKKKEGITARTWDIKKKELTVSYDPSKTSVQAIGDKVASVGYDNEYATAPKEKYDALHSCCKYERPAGK